MEKATATRAKPPYEKVDALNVKACIEYGLSKFTNDGARLFIAQP